MKRANLERLLRFLRGEEGELDLEPAAREELADWLETRLHAESGESSRASKAKKRSRGVAGKGVAGGRATAGAKARQRRGSPPAGAVALLYCDGASRGNPGPAALGFVVSMDGETLLEHGETLGRMTNNQAEYRAMLAGLEAVRTLGFERVELRLDSELIVRQLEGRYKVKNAQLKPLYARAQALLGEFARWGVEHVPREENHAADALANEALDSL